MVMTPLVRATRFVNGTRQLSDPRNQKTRKPNDIKLDTSDYIGDIAPHANFGIPILTEAGAQMHMHKLLLFSVSIFYTPITYFTSVCSCRDCTVWLIFMVNGSKDVFPCHLCHFPGANKIFLYFLLFFYKKTLKALFCEVKLRSAISLVLQNRAVKFACMGFWLFIHLC